MNVKMFCRGILSAVAGSTLSMIGPHLPLAQAQVSPEMKVQAQALASLCRGDYENLCRGVQPGGGRILACLQNHLGELTPRCRLAMPQARALESKAVRDGVLPK